MAPGLRERWPRSADSAGRRSLAGTGPVIAYQRWRLMEPVGVARQNGRILPDSRPFRWSIWPPVIRECAACPILLRRAAAHVVSIRPRSLTAARAVRVPRVASGAAH